MERETPQPPVVDNSSCICRAGGGSKSVSGSKKLIPPPMFCPETIIKPSIHPSKNSAAQGDPNSNTSPLLPGLPDDIALACLIRVPRIEHRKMRLVCKRWRRLLSGNYYYSLRKRIGVTEQWVYVMRRDKEGKISWDAYDPVYQLWQPLPPIPVDYSEALGFGCAVLSGCRLYLFGGKDLVRGSMKRVIFYNVRTNRWHRAPDMLRRRQFFGSCVLDNCLYVAGGETEGVHQPLRSVEVYDPKKNRWSFAADMNMPMVPFVGAVYRGKWLLKGLGSRRQVLSEAYFPEINRWYPVFDGMVSGWRNPSICLDDKLYGLDCKDGCRLRVYDEESDSWSKHLDSKQHMGGSQALEAAGIVPLNGKLCIVRNNMSISVVDISGVDTGDAHQWETIGARGSVRSFITTIWSNITGRKHTRSHVIHCQVLQA